MKKAKLWLAGKLFRFGERMLAKAGELGLETSFAVRDCYVQARGPNDKPFRANRLGWALANLERFVVIPRETMLMPGRRMQVIRDLVFPNVNGRLAAPYYRSEDDPFTLSPPAQAFVDELARLSREERAAMNRLEVAWPGWFKKAEAFRTMEAVDRGDFSGAPT